MPRLGSTAPIYTWAVENSNGRWLRDIIIPRFIQLPLPVVIVGGIFVYFLLIVAFAFIYYTEGNECYIVEDGQTFGFDKMVWLSGHTFTTVGYGSIYPTCATAQLVMVMEQYVALIVGSILGALVLMDLMQPRARIRFANVALFQILEDGGCQLSIRLVNDSYYGLESAKCQVMCQLWGESHAPQVKLPLYCDFQAKVTHGQPWTLLHELDCASPIAISMDLVKRRYSHEEHYERIDYANEADRKLSAEHLKMIFGAIMWIDVVMVAVDSVFGQDVRFHKRYFLKDLVSHARWVDMVRAEVVSRRPDGSTEELHVTYDHSKLDQFVEHGDGGYVPPKYVETAEDDGEDGPVQPHSYTPSRGRADPACRLANDRGMTFANLHRISKSDDNTAQGAGRQALRRMTIT
uniref:Potassium channel domain-containing protein n=1 Tax=Haptolina brevifila TaxID=156173 RepID=A0A7S2NRE7_9EUKA|mmetsp:Transcript_86779/g.173221  ORF Transcript_86779/g.173221 Transcript_86779/m.173221 type:complete len:405 (+) Transcript_86779:182-1396(+)|eukprot:CAMPEP_0174737672 /NCGR_PEP_ID=MMETSP1094-20130205/68687_1 /TAXON_ID=156173 /ORGANISM="Chrysochromulina brevifilum, Strain UTEX LB 985" /LENGTH=404 /DNA_ID=CAMNT_0015940937 /DNA_START=177 /DNA_END=1391 /DNA_ORIENTATION=+